MAAEVRRHSTNDTHRLFLECVPVATDTNEASGPKAMDFHFQSGVPPCHSIAVEAQISGTAQRLQVADMLQG